MSSSHETAILAGGCFWGMQDLLGFVAKIQLRRRKCEDGVCEQVHSG
jgi:peptide methionine sulfoxide reductase MsrA